MVYYSFGCYIKIETNALCSVPAEGYLPNVVTFLAVEVCFPFDAIK